MKNRCPDLLHVYLRKRAPRSWAELSSNEAKSLLRHGRRMAPHQMAEVTKSLKQLKRKKTMRTWSAVLTVLATLIVSGALTGCGGQSYRDGYYTNIPGYGSSGSNGGSSSGNGSNGGGGSIITDGSDDDSFVSSTSTSFSITGAGGTQPSVTVSGISTDSVLKVRISVDGASAVSIPTYSNYVGSYDCASYVITVLGKQVRTKALSLSGQCPNGVSQDMWGYPHLNLTSAESSQVIDFSNQISSGVTNISLKIDQVKYDYYCNLARAGYISPYYASNYCGNSLYPAYKPHVVNGTLEIQVNSL